MPENVIYVDDDAGYNKFGAAYNTNAKKVGTYMHRYGAWYLGTNIPSVELSPGMVHNAIIQPDYAHLYRVTIPAEQRIIVSLEDTSSSYFYKNMGIYTVDGESLFSRSNYHGDIRSDVIPVFGAGTYYIRVGGQNAEANGNYSLSVTTDPLQLTDITPGTVYNAVLQSGAQQYYRVTIPRGNVRFTKPSTRIKKRLIIGGAAVILILLFLLYGPFEGFRLLFINTAMYSSRFQFLARSLYSENYIESVLEINKPAVDRKTNTEMVNIVGGEGLYFAPVKGNYYTGFIIKIENPARLTLVSSHNSEGKLLEELTAEHNALGGINASGYTNHELKGEAWGITILNGDYLTHCSDGDRHVMGGFSRDHKLSVGYFTEDEIAAQNYLWAVEFGPLLIVNGEKSELTQFSGGLSPRTAIGQTKDGSVLLLVVDGRRAGSIGATYRDTQTILYANGAVNAIGLDGGSSSSMVYEGTLVNTPSEGDTERLLPNAIIFY